MKHTGGSPLTRMDKRRQRGDRTRRVVLAAAVDLASLDGLDGLSFGRLATLSDLSKAGIQAHFTTKEALQRATIARAAERFDEMVIVPTASLADGTGRLGALLQRWFDYAETAFAGGCSWVATLAEQDSRLGPLRDDLARQHRIWLSLLADQVRTAQATDGPAIEDPELLAFEVDAILRASNTAYQLGDTAAFIRAQRVLDARLSSLPQ